MPIRWISQSSDAAIERRIQTESIEATGAYVSKKSMPGCWVYPWASMQAQYWVMSPALSHLTL